MMTRQIIVAGNRVKAISTANLAFSVEINFFGALSLDHIKVGRIQPFGMVIIATIIKTQLT